EPDDVTAAERKPTHALPETSAHLAPLTVAPCFAAPCAVVVTNCWFDLGCARRWSVCANCCIHATARHHGSANSTAPRAVEALRAPWDINQPEIVNALSRT